MDEDNNLHNLRLLIKDISADILVMFLNKKLEIANACLQDFLLSERHSFFHLLKENECCACTAIPIAGTSATCLSLTQWSHLYCINRSSCRFDKDCVCKYNVQENVKSSELDIPLCSILLLNSSVLETLESEKSHIKRICKHRNKLAHITSTMCSNEVDKISFQIFWNEVSLSVMQLARACSLELAVQTEEKIILARTQQLSRPEISMMIHAYPMRDTSTELIYEREPSGGAVYDAVDRMNNRCITPIPQQQVPQDIKRIRARLLEDKIKDFIISNLDATIVIESLKSKELLTNSDAQQVYDIDGMKSRSKHLLQTLLSKDDAMVYGFLDSLRETQQMLIHNFIKATDDCQSTVPIEFEFGMPHTRQSGSDLSLHITLTNRSDLESTIVDVIQDKKDEINELTMKFANMSLLDAEIGSIIIRLKSENQNAIEKFYNASLNGKLRMLIEEILKRTGVIEDLIRDQVNVVVKISIDGTQREPTTFYERNWQFLVKEVSPRPMAALLLERGVLNNSDIQEIFHADNFTFFSQSHSLIHKLNLSWDETVVEFKQCLSLTSQSYTRNVIGAIEDQLKKESRGRYKHSHQRSEV